MQDDLSPISPGEWHYGTAAHLLERAGFGGTPEQISALAALSPGEAVAMGAGLGGGGAARHMGQG